MLIKNSIVFAIFFSCVSISFSQQSHGNLRDFAHPELIKAFKINIPQKRIDDIRERVLTSRIPRQMPPDSGFTSNWQTGMDVKWLEGLKQYWLNKYDWRKAEKRLNSYPQYIAHIDGYDIQFYYIKGEGKNPTPLILTHGWPGSFYEFFKVIDPLTTPSKYGGLESDAFTLIIPALPGFGFSSMPPVPVNGMTTAKLWNKLMTEIIGYDKYLAQGGDWGAGVTSHLAYLFPQHVKAISINMFIWGTPVPVNEQTDAEKKYFSESDAYWQANFDYGRMQTNKPMMPAVALYDSPLGTAGWIAEKFWAWSDNDGDLDKVISKDDLLTDIMLYLVNEGGIDGSFWYYRGFSRELKGVGLPGYITVPTALAIFPKELLLARPPLEYAKKVYNVFRFTNMQKGGHFAAFEQPELFYKEIRASFKDYHN